MLSNNTLELFKRASNEIKAYKDFLSLHGINPEHINSIEDLYSLPMTSKKNYLIPNKLKDLVWPADLNGNLEFCSTSGSTGEPYYFPRNDDLARQYSLNAPHMAMDGHYSLTVSGWECGSGVF
jgi:phenylacetate-coenzyme A ligase PaaK-like adenylate-forming protein